MPKKIILYNLKEGIKDEDYKKWCEDYKGTLLLGLKGSKSFTLLEMLGGITGNGQKVTSPAPTNPPFKYLGIMDVTSLEE